MRIPSAHRKAAPRSLGFTLMEAMVSIAIMTMILVIVDQVFIVNEDVLVKQMTRIDNDIGAIFALKRLGELARGATTVLASQTINGTSYTSSAATLVIKLPSIDSSNNVIANTFDYIAVYRDGTDATKIYTDTQKNGSSVRVNGKKLLTAYNNTMTFSYNNATVSSATRVSVYLINQQTTRGSTLTTKAWTSIFLRNF